MRRLARRWTEILAGAAQHMEGGDAGAADRGWPGLGPMRRLAALAALLLTAGQAAAQLPAPSIRSATLAPATGVLTIVGEHLGPDVQVMVDGQLVTALPGATDTQVDVAAPATVLMTPGTYRLVVFDPVRKAWDGFVVASAATATVPVAANAEAAPGTDAGAADTSRPSSASVAAGATDGATALTPRPLAIIEDTGSPFRTALGHRALNSNTTGSSNTAVGYDALTGNTSGASNTAVGRDALSSNTTGSSNTAVGRAALSNNTTGSLNLALGHGALAANADGAANTALGYFALGAAATPSGNTVVGAFTMANAITADRSVAVGTSALANVTNGSGNVAVGNAAANLNVSGSFNVAVGQQALGNSTGDSNVAVGHLAGFDTTGGSHNVYLGANVRGAAADDNTMRLGLAYNTTTQEGQNKTFIAGIRGTTVTGGQGVYVDANGQLGSGPVVPAADTVGSAQVIADSLTAADLAPAAVGTSEIADGSVTPAKVSFAFAGVGANTFTGTQKVNVGNLDLDPSSTSAGNVTKNGARFLSNPGNRNTFLGLSSGTLTPTGDDNVAAGAAALTSLDAGAFNVATGSDALTSATNGSGNTGSGYSALYGTTTGSYNTALGYGAGQANTTGSHNVYVGANVSGTASDANTMRLGAPYNAVAQEGQNKTFIAGVAGTVLTGPAVQVFIDGNGQLGTLVPAPFTGTINQPITANPRTDVAALLQTLDDQRALIAALTARVAALEARESAASVAPVRRRR